VQTVFNHFASKEELFFADRAPWVDGPAEAIRSREPHVLPLTALRRHFVELVRAYVLAAASDEHRGLIAVLEASPTLCVYERELHHEAVTKLAGALAEAVCDGGDSGESERCQPGSVSLAASLTASVWLAAIRAVLLEQRSAPPTNADAATVEGVVEVTERILKELERGRLLRPLFGRTITSGADIADPAVLTGQSRTPRAAAS
jgi:AcrR family transcriptional regulator